MPYVERSDVLGELEAWASTDRAFAACVVGGRGGYGKSRLGIELCVRANAENWVAGFLSQRADAASFEALVGVSAHRLVVVDYAESRTEQLEVLLPLLAARASGDHRVRVMLLVRSTPRRSGDWTEALRLTDSLDTILDDAVCWILDDSPFGEADRLELFTKAAAAFAERAGVAAPDFPVLQDESDLASPLLVVIAASLAVHSDDSYPTSRSEMFDELIRHEDRYWQANSPDLGTDRDLRMRIVAMATLAGATNETEATNLLQLLPDLADANAERRGRLARWVHGLYGGPEWWNPLEPDLASYLRRSGQHFPRSCSNKLTPVPAHLDQGIEESVALVR